MKLYSKEGLLLYFFLVVLLNNKANASFDDMHEDIEVEMDESVLPIDDHSTVDARSKQRSDLCEIPDLDYHGEEPSTLLNCVGDCKGDNDCDPVLGLECTGSNAFSDRIAGCKGLLGRKGVKQYSHYCSNDKILRRLPRKYGYLPMKQCEGSCRSSNDCGDGLVCRDISKDYEPDSRAEPGCSNPCNVQVVGAKFCVPPEVSLLPYGSDSPNMCEQCYEDDDECPPMQVCTSYDGLAIWFESVPGCSLSVDVLDEGEPDMKFCTKPFAAGVVGIKEEVNTRLGQCEGNCKNHDDCIGPLECFKREANELVPGCNFEKEGNSRFFSLVGYNICHERRMRSISKDLNNGPWGYRCDKDSDCLDGYECAQRNGYTTLQFMSGNSKRSLDHCSPKFPWCPKQKVYVREKILKDQRTIESQRYNGENHCCNNFVLKFGKQPDYGVVPIGGKPCLCDDAVGYTYFWQIKNDWRVKIGCARHSKDYKGEWERNCFQRIRDETITIGKFDSPVEIDFFCAKVKPGFRYQREFYKNFDNFNFRRIGPSKELKSCNAAEVKMQDYSYCDRNWMKTTPSLHDAVEDDGKDGKTEWFANGKVTRTYLKELEEVFKKLVPGMESRKGTTKKEYWKGPVKWKVDYNTW